MAIMDLKLDSGRRFCRGAYPRQMRFAVKHLNGYSEGPVFNRPAIPLNNDLTQLHLLKTVKREVVDEFTGETVIKTKLALTPDAVRYALKTVGEIGDFSSVEVDSHIARLKEGLKELWGKLIEKIEETYADVFEREDRLREEAISEDDYETMKKLNFQFYREAKLAVRKIGTEFENEKRAEFELPSPGNKFILDIIEETIKQLDGNFFLIDQALNELGFVLGD